MIRAIELKNFKCFSSLGMELGKLNVLAGSNGTGKSTIIQALLVLFQSKLSGALERHRLQLNGPLVALGTGKDVLYKRSDVDGLSVRVQDEVRVRTIFAHVHASEVGHTLEIASDSPSGEGFPFLDQRLLYLSADRLGPQKFYPMNLDEAVGNPIGQRGEFAPVLFRKSREQRILNRRLVLENASGETFIDLETQFTLWMRRLFPGFELNTEELTQLDSVLLGLSLQQQIGQSEFLRPSNVGFGVSFVLPVVLAGLLVDANTVLIVENPEAHLHPSAQSLMGEFLARVAVGGGQLFVETHSDHVVNGMRLAFKNGVVSESDLKFFAFSRADLYGSHHVTPVFLDKDGDFSSRPDSFFDQTDKDLKLLYGL
jgi:predicted ATPase